MINPETDKDALLLHCKRWHPIVVAPVEKSKVVTAVQRVYACYNKRAPLVIVCQSPWQMILMKAALQRGLDEETGRSFKHAPDNPFAVPEWRWMWVSLWKTMMAETTPEQRVELAANDKPGNPGTKDFWTSVIQALVSGTISGAWSNWKPSLRDRLSSMSTDLESAASRQFDNAALQQLRNSYANYRSTSESNNTIAQITNELVFETFHVNPIDISTEFILNLASPVNFLTGIWSSLLGERKPAPNRSSVEQIYYEFGLLSLLSINNVFMPQSLIGSLPMYDFLRTRGLGISTEYSDKIRAIRELCMASQYAMLFEQVCICCEPPQIFATDGDNRLHDEDGAAAVFSDGFKVYSWHGTSVPRSIIEHPERISVPSILAQQNTEIRRVMMERYGTDRFYRECGAKRIQEDECGVLYRKEVHDGAPLVMVKVINSTPEPDGSRKEYFIRVPDHIKTARAGVAWSFNMKADEYSPDVET